MTEVTQSKLSPQDPIPCLTVNVHPNITREQLHTMVDRIIGLSGCTGCGLLGFDVHILGGDLRVFEQFRDLEGVQSVRFAPATGQP